MPPGTATLPTLSVTQMKLLAPPGFVSPRQRVDYDAPEFLEVLQQAFPFFLPSPSKMDEGIVTYYLEGLKTCQPLYDSGLLNKSNKKSLNQGLGKLEALCKDEQIPENLRSMLLNLRVPDPRLEPERYQLAKMETGSQKLIALWGYESAASPHIPVREAIELLAPLPEQEVLDVERSMKKPLMLLSLLVLVTLSTIVIGLNMLSSEADTAVEKEIVRGELLPLSKEVQNSASAADKATLDAAQNMDERASFKTQETIGLNIESMISASELQKADSKDLFDEIVR